MHGRRQVSVKVHRLLKSVEILVYRNQTASVFSILAVFLLLVAWWAYVSYDPCGGGIITENLCNQYHQGEAAGGLCYELCNEHSVYLSYCITDGDRKGFQWNDMVIRVDPVLYHADYKILHVQEGLQVTDFQRMIHNFLNFRLGRAGHQDLVNKLLAFCDFNQDGKINLGEAQSLWRLIHLQDFLITFMFQSSIAFPRINGTCGTLYAVQLPSVEQLYDRDHQSFLSKIFSSAYRWHFPSWPRRAKIALGLLEFTMDIYENSDLMFYLCDTAPTQFGYSRNWEVMVRNVLRIFSQKMLQVQLENRTCEKNAHCTFSSQCTSRCDRNLGMCTGEVVTPTLYYTCEIIREYLLFDAPRHLQYDLGRLLDKCRNIGSNGSRELQDVQHSLLLYSLKTFLWDEIKYQDNL